LGGGVYKKRLNSNRYRSIILARTARYWIYEYLFSKTSRDNIDDGELAGFRVLAQGYARLSESQLKEMLQCQSLLEICHDNQKTSIQERCLRSHPFVRGGAAQGGRDQ